MPTALKALEAEVGRKYTDEAISRGSFLMEVYIFISVWFQQNSSEIARHKAVKYLGKEINEYLSSNILS